MTDVRNTVAGRAFTLVLSVCLAFQADGQAPPAQTEAPNDLFVNVGKSLVVDSAKPIERVSVGLGEIAEATAVGPREILLNGKAPGQTSLIVWQQGGDKLFFDVSVQPSHFNSDARLEALRREINRELPGQKIDPAIDNDLIFLRGSVKDLTSADRAMAIASAIGKAVNLLYVDVPAGEAQILLKVKFASVDRSKSDQLGMNLFSLGATNTIGSATTGQFPSVPPFNFQGFTTKGNLNTPAVVQNYSLSSALNLFFFRPDLDLGATIQALQSNNLLEVLAEPNVLTEDGKQASFLAGGEFPYPVVQGGTSGTSTAISIQFRQFGVRLNFIPKITPRGTIHLQVAPEVSALDYTNGVTLQGFTVPGVSVRNVNTEVELAEGQSFAIGGLLDNRETQQLQKVPFIGDIPILGKFFQSRQKTKSNTELMVIVTPQIVHPIPAGQPTPEIKFPVPLLESNAGKDGATPGAPATVAQAAPPPANIPVENLLRSMQQRPLVIQGTTGMFGGASSLSGGGATAPAPASPPAAPTPGPAPQ